MEKKNVQRIVGVLVITAVAIVAMPLMFGRSDVVVQEAENTVKTPVVSDQVNSVTTAKTDDVTPAAQTPNMETPNSSDMSANAAQNINDAANVENSVNANLNSDVANPAPVATSASATPSAMSAAPAAPTDMQASAASMQNAPALPVPTLDTIKKADSSASQDVVSTPTTAPGMQQAAATTDQNTVMPDMATSQKMASATDATADAKAAPAKKHKKKSTKSISAKANTKAVKAGWVVQMGSFNNKQNALHLADKLRAAGFNVFTREMKSASGKMSTRVYIGPEVKEASATQLSGKIHQKMNMQGIVMAYKPASA